MTWEYMIIPAIGVIFSPFTLALLWGSFKDSRINDSTVTFRYH